MRRLITTLAVAAIGVAVMACTTIGGGSTSGTGGTGGTIEGVGWVLTSYDVDGTLTPVADGLTADARFAEGQVAGSSGCNRYTGPATISGATIEIGQTTGTLIGCEGPAAELESAYLANLAEAATFTATADTLMLFDTAGTVLLEYAAGAANPLEGAWTVTGYNNGQEAVVSPIAGSELTAEFTADQVSGSSGCNTFNGAYTLTDDQVAIGPLATTRMACEQDVMDQETQFLVALATPATVEVSGGVVTLRDADGATQVTLTAK